MKQFGLIGYPLTHSFSKKYFTEKFEKLGISETHMYSLFEMQNLDFFKRFVEESGEIEGINVTIPHKVNVMQYLDEIDTAAQKIGAVNVIKVNADKTLKGYNSDYYGFKKSCGTLLNGKENIKALVLGNGGAAKAILVALADMYIPHKLVSRTKTAETISYQEANELLPTHQLVINCTPLGTYPNMDASPDINFENVGPNHFFFDLVYNPEESKMLTQAKAKGAAIKNGYEMLELQAEKSWEIWNEVKLL